MFTLDKKTILFVSHNRSETLELSNKCIWLDKGKIKRIGSPAEVLGEYFIMHRDNYDEKKMIIDIENNENYLQSNSNGIIDLDWSEENAPGNDILSIRHISVKSSSNSPDRIFHHDSIRLTIIIQKKRKGVQIGAFFFLQDIFYQPVLTGHFLNNFGGWDYGRQIKDETGLIEITCTIPPAFLMAGKYYLMLRFGMEEKEWNAESEEAFRFSEKLNFMIYASPDHIELIGDISKGSVRPPLDWQIQKIANF